MQLQADFIVQVGTVLLTSEFGSSTRGEKHNSSYADHTMLTQQPHSANRDV